jgi:hypothetical protein
MGLAPVLSPPSLHQPTTTNYQKMFPFLLWKNINQSDKISHLLWQ